MSKRYSRRVRRQTLRDIRRPESALYRILVDEQAIPGYSMQGYLSLIHSEISAQYNCGGTREAIADALQSTSDSIYGMPLQRQIAWTPADRIRRELEIGRP